MAKPNTCWVCGQPWPDLPEIPVGMESTHCRAIRLYLGKIAECRREINGSKQHCVWPGDDCKVLTRLAEAFERKHSPKG